MVGDVVVPSWRAIGGGHVRRDGDWRVMQVEERPDPVRPSSITRLEGLEDHRTRSCGARALALSAQEFLRDVLQLFESASFAGAHNTEALIRQCMQIKRNLRTRLGRILGLNRQGMGTVEFANLITDSGVESGIRVSNLQLLLNLF